MKKEYIIIGLLIAVITIGSIGYVADKDRMPIKSTTSAKDDYRVGIESDKYETLQPNAKRAFMIGCTSSGETTETQCSCMYDQLDNKLTNAEFSQVIKDSVDGIISDNMWSAAKACV